MPLSIKEIENALENKDEAQKERYVFGILKHFHPLAFPYDDWLLKWHKEHAENNRNSIAKGESWLAESLNDEEEIIKEIEARHKKIFLAYRRRMGSTPIEQCLYWFHEYAMIFGGKLNVVLNAYDVAVNKVAERFPPQYGEQDCNVYACAILLCLAYSHQQTKDCKEAFKEPQQQNANTQESKVVRTEISDKRINVSDWAITDAQKAAIRKIIDNGDRTKRSKRETLRLILEHLKNESVAFPQFKDFFPVFQFSNRSDYNNEVRKFNEAPRKIDKVFSR